MKSLSKSVVYSANQDTLDGIVPTTNRFASRVTLTGMPETILDICNHLASGGLTDKKMLCIRVCSHMIKYLVQLCGLIYLLVMLSEVSSGTPFIYICISSQVSSSVLLLVELLFLQ